MERAIDENRRAFQKFLKLCCVATKNDTVVLSLMKQSFDRTDTNYLGSSEFSELLEACTDRINDDPANKFVHILYFINELKPHKVKRPKPPPSRRHQSTSSGEEESERKRFKAAESTDVCLAINSGDTQKSTDIQSHSKRLPLPIESEVVNCSLTYTVTTTSSKSSSVQELQPDAVCEVNSEASLPSTLSLIQACHVESFQLKASSANSSKVEVVGCTSSDGNVNVDSDSSKEVGASSSAAGASASQIRRLEKLLVAIDRQIQKLQEKELTLEEMEDDSSAYILEDKYKKKFVAVWNKLCEVKGVANLTGRPIEKAVKFEGTKYSEVNRRISRYVNKYKVFPDFQDIYEIINASNTKFNLGIKRQSIVSLAREAFMSLGNMLQSRRIKDYMSDFGCHLTDNVNIRDDPALTDPIVKEKLKSNRQQGVKRLEEVINKFVEIQEKTGDELEKTADDENKKSCEMSDEDDDLLVVSVESLPNKTSPTSLNDEIIILDDEDSNLPKTDDVQVTFSSDFADCNRNFDSKVSSDS